MIGQIVTASPKALALTMTSLDLVDFINSDRKQKALDVGAAFPSPGFAMLEHADFLKKAPAVLGRGVGKFSDTYTHLQNGQTYPCYRFPKREACLMAMSFSYELQAKVFDRMTTIEAQAATPAAPAIPQSLSAALRLAADQADQIEAQQAQLAIAAPKVAFVESYVDSTGLKGFRQVAKLLQVKENEFRKFLADRKIMYLLGGEWVPCAQHLDAGRFKVKTGTSVANGHAFNEAKFTAKGVEWIAGLIASNRVSNALKKCK